jgi:hypothetical protein
MVDIHVQVEMYGGREIHYLGEGRVRSIHGGFACTGGDVLFSGFYG